LQSGQRGKKPIKKIVKRARIIGAKPYVKEGRAAEHVEPPLVPGEEGIRSRPKERGDENARSWVRTQFVTLTGGVKETRKVWSDGSKSGPRSEHRV